MLCGAGRDAFVDVLWPSVMGLERFFVVPIGEVELPTMEPSSSCGLSQSHPACSVTGGIGCGHDALPWKKGRREDDFPRLVTGFILGLVTALFIGLSNALLLAYVLERLTPYVGRIPDAWPACFCLSQLFVLSALPVVFAALLARSNRTKAAQQTLCYCYAVVVLFAVVCGRPVEIGPVIPLVVMGAGGLAGVCAVAWPESYRRPLPSSTDGARG